MSKCGVGRVKTGARRRTQGSRHLLIQSLHTNGIEVAMNMHEISSLLDNFVGLLTPGKVRYCRVWHDVFSEPDKIVSH